jgi:transcriptional regulator with XRE-family HTH domain
MSVDLGERLQSVRKRRGLTQRQLAEQSGVSLSLIRKIEQGEIDSTRLETLRKLAVGLKVRTSELQVSTDTEHADTETVDQWAAVRAALAIQPSPSDEPVTAASVRAGLRALRRFSGENRFAEGAAMLPALLRDAEDLGDRSTRSHVLNSGAWLLIQTRQYDAAEDCMWRALDAAEEQVDASAVVDNQLWSLLRQGRLAETRTLAIEWADRVEPRFSRATAMELSMWGRMWMRVANASVRDNRPGEAEDALSLASAAAHRIGREVYADRSTFKSFGPVSVAHIRAESHIIADEPDKTLEIASQTPAADLEPVGANRMRHRLDVANASVQLGRYDAALTEFQQVRQMAPEWLQHQRYGRTILGRIVAKRRTLTDDMRELADFVKLEY